MARRGEVPFVAVPVGLGHDVREVLGLARDLKIPRAQALGYWVLWKELVLTRGDAKRGTVKGLTATHLAEHVGHAGNPRKLVDAFKRAGFFRTQRGSFADVGWAATITGQYAIRKVEDRETWARQKQAQRDAAAAAAVHSNGATVHHMSTWTLGGRPGPVLVDNAQKERKESADSPPDPPASGGSSKAFGRWEWCRKEHPRAVNPRACAGYLEAMTDEDWALFQWATVAHRDGTLRSSSRKKRALDADLHQILAKQAYLQFARERDEKLRQESGPKNGGPRPQPAAPAPSGPSVEEQKRAAAIAFVVAALADETNSDAEKEKHKQRFRQAWPDVPPPWEGEGTPPAGGLPS